MAMQKNKGKSGNTKAGKEANGSSGDNAARQSAKSESPNRSGARDREGRKGGSQENRL
ncbi:hypothetical protein [Novosphingobium sp. TH158]|uniref:hypothetical protein n=1 Tax=Novosphingobium sp. TH158 TaxID=2067455 RepID=UPI00130429A6|nr:hypothetical protein [Novosphingobium sp. TH158]